MTTATTSRAIEMKMQIPLFGVVEMIPQNLTSQLENAVRDFIVKSHFPEGINPEGFFYQTLEAIANATYLGGGGDFWLGQINGEVVVYVLAHVGKDLDNKLTYHVSQAWVRRDYRNTHFVKQWWSAIQRRAKNLFCGHLVITSTRNPRAYEKFLGGGLKEYAVLLKQEL